MSERFEFRGEIERDEGSVVFRAFDRALQREVAVKRLLPHAWQGRRILARLRQEARTLARVHSTHVLLLLDCCFSGLAVSRGLESSLAFDVATSRTVLQILTAGRPGERVWDSLPGTTQHSPFTYYLLAGLRGAAATRDRSFLTGTELCAYVRCKVIEVTDARQNPLWARLSGEGEFVFQPDSLLR